MEQLLTSFGFRALWTPELIVILAIVGAVYFTLITKWRHLFKDSEPVRVRQKVYFVLALIALYIGWGSPLYIAGHIMISFHMTQMVFAYFIAVPLFIISMPKWLLYAIKRKVENYLLGRIAGKLFMNPIIGLLIFNGLFSFYHIPLVFDTLMQQVYLHSLYEVFMFIGATIMWWHMIAPLPSSATLSDLKRIGYIFANGALILPACALIIFAGKPLYSVYTDPNTWATVMSYCLPAGASIPYGLFDGPNPFSPLSATHDQQLAGVLMKIMQEITYGITVGYVFKQWISKEKQSDGPSISDIPTTTMPRATK
ncbi:cytochrome c oxidase assembly factor CtaG [Bacillus sp. FJAT-45350]|uniref:cytochrome c oxidase assembly factor CtaG n=1 Tax=Bacillus sp. FJAT-45350 TaxID=2011014 RepID=UPI000BB9A808